MSTENQMKDVGLELSFLQAMGAKIFLCPFTGRTKFQMIGFWTIYFLVFFTATQLFLTIYFNGIGDWLQVTNIAPNLGVTVIALMRYSRVHSNKEVYESILCHFYEDVWRFVATKAQNDIVARYKKTVRYFNRCLVCYSTVLSVVVTSFPYLVMTYEKKYKSSEEYLYPFDGWYPFDKIKWYWTVYWWESVMTIIVIWVYVFLNLIHSSFIRFICMELKIIGDHIEKLITPFDLSSIGEHKLANDKVLKQLKSLILEHHYLAKASANLDAVLGDSMLINYSLGAVFICLTAFTCTVVDNFYQSIRYSSMCASLLIDILISCVYGQIISDHSEDLTNAVYSSAWADCSADVKKIMLMFMVRTQKPFIISAKGFFPMNMNTFSSICSSSYQMFNLIRTMYAKKNI